jgi:catechol 2,3-dioxygenase-like lactoylglutathione lyase family enzyme
VIDHTGVTVSDYARSKAFYTRTLGAIGYAMMMEVPAALSGKTDAAGFGDAAATPPKPDFWIGQGTPNRPPVHVAFRVGKRALVDAFHGAGLAAGGTDNGAPGIRAHYHPGYYAAFVLDPDGHNVEAVCFEPA